MFLQVTFFILKIPTMYIPRTSRMAVLLSTVPFPLLAVHHISVPLSWTLTEFTVKVVMVPLVDSE